MISVIIPVYKTEKYIERCLNSVVHQTYKNLEILLIDDDSPDNCPKICDEWAKRDSRIKTFHIENKGVANARNIGISNSNGELIAFVDSDDYIESDMLELLYDNMIKENADISMCSYCHNDDMPEKNSNNIIALQSDVFMQNIVSGEYAYGFLWNKLYRRETIGNAYMPHLSYSEDMVFNYYVMKNADKMVVSDAVKYHYNVNEGSATASEFDYSNLDAVKARGIIFNDIADESLKPYALKSCVTSEFIALSQMIRNHTCLDRYDEIRSSIIAYKKDIFKSSIFDMKCKLKTFILMLSPKLYNMLIKKLKF